MSKESKSSNNGKKTGKYTKNEKESNRAERNREDYLVSMGMSPSLGESTNGFQMIPAVFFTAVVILIVRMAPYKQDMNQFFWFSSDSEGLASLTDFFSYYKMIAIIACASLCLLILLYRVFIRSFYIKRSRAYIPMIVYAVFVLLSYMGSAYKEFALTGWNDRFEGTLVLLSYMVMLFYIINTVQSEKNVKWIIYSLASSSTLLGLLGLSQALDHDFFRTDLGKKLITPSWYWNHLDKLDFTFENKEIYQTVYNINYVSFYLTLLIPIFGLLFIHSVMQKKEEPLYKKVVWGALFALLIFNLIGSSSSGGLMGMAFVVLVAVIVLNKKIIHWWKPVCILLALTIAIAGVTYERWSPELTGSINGVTGRNANHQDIGSSANGELAEKSTAENIKHRIDYMETTGAAINLGYDGDQIVFLTYPEDPSSLTVVDSKGSPLSLKLVNAAQSYYQLEDERYSWISLRPAKDEQENNYLILTTDDHDWNFMLTEDGPKYLTGTRHITNLQKVPAIGWEDNQSFGSGRGYIWSRTLPMLKDTLILGHGADTYCIYFPQYDYVGKYTSFSENLNIIVDKPHNLYFGYIVGTGGISMLALLMLWFTYLIQSFLIYRKSRYSDFLSFAGAGIFLGICGFLISALVDDSSVSVMPMFYGLLGTGIAINMMLKKSDPKKANI